MHKYFGFLSLSRCLCRRFEYLSIKIITFSGDENDNDGRNLVTEAEAFGEDFFKDVDFYRNATRGEKKATNMDCDSVGVR